MCSERQKQIAKKLAAILSNTQEGTEFAVGNPETIVMRDDRMTGRIYHLQVTANIRFEAVALVKAVLKVMADEGVVALTDNQGRYFIVEEWGTNLKSYHELICLARTGTEGCFVGLIVVDGTSGKGIGVEGNKAYFYPFGEVGVELQSADAD